MSTTIDYATEALEFLGRPENDWIPGQQQAVNVLTQNIHETDRHATWRLSGSNAGIAQSDNCDRYALEHVVMFLMMQIHVQGPTTTLVWRSVTFTIVQRELYASPNPSSEEISAPQHSC